MKQLTCPNCGYEFRGEDFYHMTVCPKCGTPLMANGIGLAHG